MKIKKKILLCVMSVLLFALTFIPSILKSSDSSVEYTECGLAAEKTAISADTKVSSRFWELFFGGERRCDTDENRDTLLYLYEGGDIFGARIKQTYTTVSDPGTHTSLKSGDKIISVNGKKVSSASEVKDAANSSGGKCMTLTCLRGGKRFECQLNPEPDGAGYKLGLTLKDGAAGIGTITYIDPQTGEFGGLGHGISDADTGETVDISGGAITGVILGGVQKGECGKPGELCGILTDKISGKVISNTPEGLFGKLDTLPSSGLTKVMIGRRDEVKEGEATIRCTLKNGKKSDYKIEIFDIDPTSKETKSFKIKVTDPALLAITGGIVRGMSGSPIIQDGKLVGAVTHVMVADPTEGYGIFIENMLNAAQSQVQPKAA